LRNRRKEKWPRRYGRTEDERSMRPIKKSDTKCFSDSLYGAEEAGVLLVTEEEVIIELFAAY